MKLVSWNVAGFRACLKKGFENFFNRVEADIVCLQEVKTEEQEINFKPNGYKLYLNTADKKGYAGTLVYARKEPLSVKYGMGIDAHDHEGRLITLEYEDFYLINTYVPHCGREVVRLPYRITWEEAFLKYIKSLKKPLIICGDFNVAHTEMDIKNVKANIGNAGFTYEEREMFSNLLESGFIDTFRYLNPDKMDAYSWWSYRLGVRARNIGWRIDYFVVSESLKDRLIDATIYSETLGSDHCPIGIEIK